MAQFKACASTVEVTVVSEDERQREGEVLNTAVCSPGRI